MSQAVLKKSKGRPSGDDSADIKQAILDAAEERFAASGYAATSLRKIADQVGVNPAMVHYYFGNKRTLLQRVLERSLVPMAAAIAEMKTDEKASAPEVARRLLITMAEHPSLPALLVREVMLPGGVMQEHFIEKLAPHLGGAVTGLLNREQEESRLRADFNPQISSVMLLSLCMFPFIVRDLAKAVLHVTYDDKGMKELEQHICGFLEQGFSS